MVFIWRSIKVTLKNIEDHITYTTLNFKALIFWMKFFDWEVSKKLPLCTRKYCNSSRSKTKPKSYQLKKILVKFSRRKQLFSICCVIMNWMYFKRQTTKSIRQSLLITRIKLPFKFRFRKYKGICIYKYIYTFFIDVFVYTRYESNFIWLKTKKFFACFDCLPKGS